MRRWLAALLPLTLAAGGCGTEDRGATPATATESTSPTTQSGEAPLPGERQEIYPYQGAKLAVVGVAADDTLKVRSGPGTEFTVLFELPPTAMNATATGHNRSVRDGGFWSEIVVDDRTGWANTAFLLQPGQVNDITAALYPTPADRPKAETMPALGRTVVQDRAGNDPEGDSVVVDGPTVGDLGEITIDIVGLGDDSVGGERLKIFAEPGPDGRTFTVRSIEATTFCSRGVTPDGLCV